VHSGLSPTTRIKDVKEETLSALQANVAQNALDVLAMDPPEFDVQTVDDFELCRAIKQRGGLSGDYEILEASTKLGDCGITGWEILFLQFRDRESGEYIFSIKVSIQAIRAIVLGKLLPIAYTLPPLTEDDREVPVFQGTDIKGKRKASVELDEITLDF